MHAGDTIELTINGLTGQGKGVGRYEGLAVFVADTLPGETVSVRIATKKKKYAEGQLVKIINSSPERVKPVCPAFFDCGGCVFQHIYYSHQLSYKRQTVADALKRIGKLDVDVLPVIPCEPPFHYRNRITFHVKWQNGIPKIGLYKTNSYDIFADADCLLVPDSINDLAAQIRALLPKYAAEMCALREITIRINADGNLLVIFVLEDTVAVLPEFVAHLCGQNKKIISVFENSGKPVYGIYGDNWSCVFGEEKFPDRIGEILLNISPGSFLQVNHMQAVRMYNTISAFADLSGKEKIWDLYSGVGSIALYLAKRAMSIIGVESYALAVEDAIANAKINNINNCRFIVGAAELIGSELLASGEVPDIVILDPPRAGCENSVLQTICNVSPKKVIYASCDPATLARDLGYLSNNGYQVVKVQPIDMFPQAGHVECVVLMSRKDG